MKKCKRKWILFYSQLLSAAMAVLGVVSCSSSRKVAQPPLMYGVPYDGIMSIDTIRKNQEERKLMYGVPPARYESIEQKKDSAKAGASKTFPVQSEMKAMYGPPPAPYQKRVETETGDIIINMYHQNP